MILSRLIIVRAAQNINGSTCCYQVESDDLDIGNKQQLRINIEIDFLSLYERDPAIQERFSHEPELLCQARGLSVYEEKKDILRLKRRVRRLRDHAVGYRELTPESGVIKPTSSRYGQSHRTWWVPIEIYPWDGFEIEEL